METYYVSKLIIVGCPVALCELLSKINYWADDVEICSHF